MLSDLPSSNGEKSGLRHTFLSLLLRKRLSVGNWLGTTLLTIKSMVQILARERMLHIPSRVSDTSLHLSIVALKQTWLEIEGKEVVDDSDTLKGSHR